MRRLQLVMLMTVVAGAVAVGCGSDGEEPEGGGDAPADAVLLEGDAVEIRAVDNAFDPEAARVAAGTRVTFFNSGVNDHNVIPEDEGAAWRIDTEDFGPGGEASFTFDDPGVYRFYCSIHGTLTAGMPGVLVVE